jgi:3-oxoacyl-[acyl-carrier-protein] synthase II
MEKKRVVITGISAITGKSLGKDQLWEDLNNKKMYAVPVKESYEKNYTFKSRFYIPFPEVKMEDHDIPSKFGISMEDNSKLAMICTKAAIEDAGFNLEKTDKGYFKANPLEDAGIIVGMAQGALKSAFASVIQHVAGHLKQEELSSFRFHRMVVPVTMDNSVAAWISILFGIKGQAYTVNASCASGNFAIGEAYKKIMYGETNIMIAGGVESLNDGCGATMRGFDSLGALTHSPIGQPQPFSKNRSGFLFSEGGCGILVLEELEHALARGANIYAEIAGCSFNTDSYSIVQIDDSGNQIVKLLSVLTKDHKIDYFNAHGTGTTLNDSVESAVIRQIFGGAKSQPLVNSTKSILGHSIGASSAIEAIVTAMSIKKQHVHPNLSEDNIDDLNIVTESRPAVINYAISASYGFGGHNSALLLKKFD